MALAAQDSHKAVITSVGSAVGGGTASSTKPVITGTADAGTTVDIFDGVRVIGTAIVDSNGNWSFTPTADLKAGSHSFTAISVDSNGDFGASSSPMSVKVPAAIPVGPATPVIDGGGPTDDTGNPLPNPTNDPRPEMSGTGTPGDTITMYDGNTPIGSTVIDGTGQWHVKPEKDLDSGSHDIYVIETTPAGVPSQPSDHYTVVIDTNVPKAPIVTGLTDDNGIAIPNGGATPDGHPTMSGTGEPGDIVKMYDGQEVIGSAKVDANGNWSITPTKDLSDAIHDLYAIETNAAGTSGQTSDHFIITVDSSMPATPVAPTMTDDSGATIPAGSTTADPHPHIDGKGTAGDTITLYDNGTVIGSTTVNGDGTWSFTPSPDLGSGNHDIVVIETNPAGTPSNPSDPIHVVIDTSAPIQPAVPTLTDDSGAMIPPGSTTSDAHPHISGTGTAGDLIKVYDGSTVIGSTTVGGDGKWSFTPTSDLPNGPHSVHVVEVNTMGTPSVASDSINVVIGPMIAPSIDFGVYNNQHQLLNKYYDFTGSLTIEGTITGYVPGSKVSLSFWGSAMSSPLQKSSLEALVTADGKFMLTLGKNYLVNGYPFVAGPGSINIEAWVYPPGQVGIQSTQWGAVNAVSWTDTCATFAPRAPILLHDNGVTIPAGSSTTDTHPMLRGAAESGDRITVYDGSTVIGTVIVPDNGIWTFTSPTLSNDLHTLSVTDTNSNGFVSARSDSVTINVNTSGLRAPVLTDDSGAMIPPGSATTDAHPHISGTGTVGDLIKVYDGSTLLGSTTIDSAGKWSFTPGDLTPGPHSIAVVEADSTGTATPLSPPVAITVAGVIPGPGFTVLATSTHSVLPAGSAYPDGGVTLFGTTVPGAVVRLYTSYYQDGRSPYLSDSVTADASGNWRIVEGWNGMSLLLMVSATVGGVEGPMSPSYKVGVGSLLYKAVLADQADDTSHAAAAGADHDTQSVVQHTATDDPVQPAHPADQRTVVAEHDTFVGKAENGNETVDLNADPASYFKETTAHIQGAGGVTIDTLHLTGDHQVLDLTSLTGKTAAAKISGIEVVDLGGQHNTLKLSLIDVLNLGETDLFQKDGKQQMMVQGKDGDTVDLSNTHIAGLADGEWAQHGTAVVGGVTYNVYEHSGAHTELLVRQGVQIVVH